MNYLWDLVIKAKKMGIAKKDLYFLLAKVYSPYMELSNENLNGKTVEQNVEVNPYYRFYEIFKDLFAPDDFDDLELRKVFFDLVLHFLTDLDLRQGMNKEKFYVKFILDDLLAGMFGKINQAKLQFFDEAEQVIIAENLMKLYVTGEMFYLLKNTLRKIFPNSTIYANYETNDELLFFLDYERNQVNESKLQLIQEFFLPLRFRMEIYWKQHFGIIGIDETMKMDFLVLY